LNDGVDNSFVEELQCARVGHDSWQRLLYHHVHVQCWLWVQQWHNIIHLGSNQVVFVTTVYNYNYV